MPRLQAAAIVAGVAGIAVSIYLTVVHYAGFVPACPVGLGASDHSGDEAPLQSEGSPMGAEINHAAASAMMSGTLRSRIQSARSGSMRA